MSVPQTHHGVNSTASLLKAMEGVSTFSGMTKRYHSCAQDVEKQPMLAWVWGAIRRQSMARKQLITSK